MDQKEIVVKLIGCSTDQVSASAIENFYGYQKNDSVNISYRLIAVKEAEKDSTFRYSNPDYVGLDYALYRITTSIKTP